MEDVKIRQLKRRVESLKKQNSELKKKLNNIEKATKRYKHSPFDYFYRIARRIRNIFKGIKKPSVTVVIPTYKKNDYLKECINSVLNQDYSKRKITIIVVHNGEDEGYFQQLKKQYEKYTNIEIIHSEKKGASAAREYARKYVTSNWMMFLDDDDYITSGYVRELISCTYDKRVGVVCGKMNDLYESGIVNEDTYINTSIKKAGNGIVHKYGAIRSNFATVCGKLYESKLFNDKLSAFDTSLKHSEDVAFWVDNIARLPNDSIWSCSNAKEAYIRRVRKDSLSRPEDDNLNSFMCQDQIELAERYTKIIFDESCDLEHKEYVLNILRTINNRMRKYYNTLDDELKAEYRQVVLSCSCPFINKSFFGKKTGIAFCHNFAPAIDASAFVATKRLSQISDYYDCEGINWIVVTADMSRVRDEDLLWNEFYARFQYSRKVVVGVDTSTRITAQDDWGNAAYMRVRDRAVDYIYSRSMWVGSHIAAYRYKKSHKNVIWIAEFSDPIAMGIDNKPKQSEELYTGEMEIFNDYYGYVENLVYEAADNIIFTNSNQKEYMLEYSGNKNNSDVECKSVVWNHPTVSSDYAYIIPHNICLDIKKINIAFFGTFYKNRSVDAVIKLLKNEDVVVHLFTKQTTEIREFALQYNNLKIYPLVSLLEMYSIVKDMDYCFVNDLDFEGEINPYLPSKLADYLSAGGTVLAQIIGNSPMRHYQHDNIIKIEEISDEFVANIKKQKIEH